MHKQHKYDFIILLALAGFAISLYLSITHYLGQTVPCDITRGCEVVLNSKYSKVFGLPLSVLGMAYFSSVIIAGLMANHYAKWRKILTALLATGALSSLIFLSLQFFVIKKVCQYCLAVDLLSLSLFILDINIEYKKIE